MTRTEVERISVLEEKVDDIKTRMERIEEKIDAAIACKADKTELVILRDKMDKALVWVAVFSFTTLAGVFIYLLESHLI